MTEQREVSTFEVKSKICSPISQDYFISHQGKGGSPCWDTPELCDSPVTCQCAPTGPASASQGPVSWLQCWPSKSLICGNANSSGHHIRFLCHFLTLQGFWEPMVIVVFFTSYLYEGKGHTWRKLRKQSMVFVFVCLWFAPLGYTFWGFLQRTRKSHINAIDYLKITSVGTPVLRLSPLHCQSNFFLEFSEYNCYDLSIFTNSAVLALACMSS